MAVVSLTTFQPVLGRVAEAVALMKEAQELLDAHGARSQVTSLFRGGVPGTLSIAAEYAGPAAYGKVTDELNADEGWQGFMARAQAAAAAQPVRSVDYMEIPGLERDFDSIAGCTVVMGSLFRVRDGRQQESIERIQRWKRLSEKHGAKCRALASIASDPANITATVAYYDDFAAWGRSGEALGADPEWQAFGAEIRGKTASADFLRTSVMRVI